MDLNHVQLKLCMLGAEEPTHHGEALKHEAWGNAMEEKLKSIRDKDTWLMVKPSKGVRAIGLKWVYKLKKDAAGK